MIKYAKVIDEQKGLCEVGLGTNIMFYDSMGMSQLDVEQSDIDNKWYLIDKCPHKTTERLLQEAKENKISDNDIARDYALDAGVVYKDVLFDSDTDQKINLLAIISIMDEQDTIVWFGKDNQSLNCNKSDLINIGELIARLQKFCWAKNSLIKAMILKAQSIKEVNSIAIDYTVDESEEQ